VQLEITRGVPASLDAPRPGSRWWRSVNAALLFDAELAALLHETNEPVDAPPSAARWLRRGARGGIQRPGAAGAESSPIPSSRPWNIIVDVRNFYPRDCPLTRGDVRKLLGKGESVLDLAVRIIDDCLIVPEATALYADAAAAPRIPELTTLVPQRQACLPPVGRASFEMGEGS
jgi:hypothetical protein